MIKVISLNFARLWYNAAIRKKESETIMTNRFLTRLKEKPLLGDGAMGTMLHSRGASGGQAFDALNLTQPELVASVHRDYVDAGADIIETNTFGANRIKLEKHGLADKVAEVNRRGVEIARRVAFSAEREVFVAGSVGPLGAHLAPLGRLQPDAAAAAFTEQVAALLEASVDVLVFETFGNLRELEIAVNAARALDADIPISAQMTFSNDGITPLGDAPAEVAALLGKLKVDIVGVNCSVGPARVLRSIKLMSEHLPPDIFIAAQPNAGWPQRLGGRLMYPATPEYFGDYAATFVRAGVAIVGGCCGTTPEHIAQMRHALDTMTDDAPPVTVQRIDVAPPSSIADVINPTELSQKLARGEFVTSVEIHPPRGASVARVLAAVQTLQEAGVSVVNVADSPVARMKMSPWAVCHLIQSEMGLETILNFPTRGRNLLRIQGDLLAAHALNIRNLFVVMGDPTTIGDYPEAFNHHDVVSTGLIKLVKHGFNAGVDYAGKPISQPTNFLVGGALNLNNSNLDKELKLLKKKIDSGVNFVMTQPIYTAEPLRRFRAAYEERYGALTLPILVSVLPLYNLRHARFLHNEVPGITISARLQARMARAGDDGAREGLAISRELLAEIKDEIAGIYIMPPFKKYNLAAELIEAVNDMMAA